MRFKPCLPFRFSPAWSPTAAALAVVWVWACVMGGAAPVAAASISENGALCRYQTERQGQMSGMPDHLLTAISFVESGRWDPDRREKTAWPWTVTAEGEGHFYNSKNEAIAAVNRLRARGIRNIDVGCMQINMYYHGEAFPNLQTAFDPAANVAYAVSFLEALERETGSWDKASTRYHSATPEYAARYRAKLQAEIASILGQPQGTAGAAGTPPRELDPNVPPPRLGDGSLLSEEQQFSIRRRALEVATTKAEEEFARAQAKAFADSWRAEKLAEYQRRKRERREALERARQQGQPYQP